MFFIRKILQSGFIKTLTTAILISVLFQSLFISEPDDPLILCIESYGHIAIEDPDQCSVHKLKQFQIENIQNKILLEKSSNTNDNSCIDIYLSNLDIFDIKLQSRIHDLLQQIESISVKAFSNFIEHFRIKIPFNQSLHKILIEYSTVSLLL